MGNRIVRSVLYILICMSISETVLAQNKMLFSSSRSSNSEIYIMDLNENAIIQTTDSENDKWSAVWKSSHEICYLEQSENDVQIKCKNLLTGSIESLNQPDECQLDDKNYRFDSKGKMRLYTCDFKVYVSDGQTAKCISCTLDGRSNYPEWLDDENILFTNNQSGSNDIYIYNINNKFIELLIGGASNDERAVVSPDNQSISFSSDRRLKGNQDIYCYKRNSGTIAPVYTGKGTELISSWSQDGQSIIFGSDMDGSWNIFKWNMSSKSLERIVESPAFDGDPRVFHPSDNN